MSVDLNALSPEDLLAGASATFEIEVPAEVLHPAAAAGRAARRAGPCGCGRSPSGPSS